MRAKQPKNRMNKQNYFNVSLVYTTLLLIFIPIQLSAQECNEHISQKDCEEGLRELAEIEEKIEETTEELREQIRARTTLERDIDIIETNIYREQLGIRARDIAIHNLQLDINYRNSELDRLETQFETQKKILLSIIQSLNETENRTLFHFVFSGDTISEFAHRFESHREFQQALQDAFNKLQRLDERLNGEKVVLLTEREEEGFLKSLQEERAREIETQKQKKEEILDLTKGVETAYQDLLLGQEQTATEIRNALFNLLGARDISFEDALELAQRVEKSTGVRAAFLLAIIEQETDLGQNLGSGQWNIDTHPTRDRPLFLSIANTLGVEPNELPVSKKLSYGWGGAMGPAQFIPSTWACYGGYVNTRTRNCIYNDKVKDFWSGPWDYQTSKDKVKIAINKKTPSSPWDPLDAFMAAGLLLKDLGATKTVYGAEWCAALKYYSGSCSKKNQVRYSFYPDNVESRTNKFARSISILGES